MLKRLLSGPAILVIQLLLSPALYAQLEGHGDDFSGVWTNFPPENTRLFQNSALRADPPPMTAWAQERYDQAKPTFGP